MALITTGQRFGRWTVLEDQQYTFVKKVSAKCDCGSRVTKVRVGNLRTGRSMSCGCINKEMLAQQGHKKLLHPVNPGDVYGRLTVVDATDRDRTLVKCECGNTKITRASALYRGNTKSCGCLKREVAVALGKSTATRGGLSDHTLYGSWGRVCRGEAPMHEPWRDNLPLFVKDVEQEIGPRPDGMFLVRKEEAPGFVPGNLMWQPRTMHKNQRVVLTAAEKLEIAELVDAGELQYEVAKYYGVSPSMVSTTYKKYRNRISAQ